MFSTKAHAIAAEPLHCAMYCMIIRLTDSWVFEFTQCAPVSSLRIHLHDNDVLKKSGKNVFSVFE